ncbi:MAG: RidA family protein [Robiginitomaculum sp.]|nr:RidA family protein [Robiginitomaculum sp.]
MLSGAGLTLATLIGCTKNVSGSGAEARLIELGIVLPDAPAPVATYVPFRRVGNLLWVAGQGPAFGSEFGQGKLGLDLTVEQGQIAARNTALNILAQVRVALGSLDKVQQCVKLGGFINCTDDFTDQPKVMNGASDLMVEVFGDAGKAARFAVGSNVLPFNISVEIESVWEVM